MPANLSPEYKAAAAAFRGARDPRERLELLREMLRTVPKHKGTEHIQADIKARIKDLSGELEGGGSRGAARGGPSHVVRPEGAGQLALLGPPNSGKSSLHARLTHSGAQVADYPFTTQLPGPGMMPYRDIHFQLIDLPAVSPAHPVPWLAATLQSADAALIVLDLGDADCLGELQAVRSMLEARRIFLTERWDAAAPEDESLAQRLPALLLANKADLLADPEAELATLSELSGLRLPSLAVSARTGAGLEALGDWLFEHLGVVRVYTKAPGHPPDRERPFALRRGQTVSDLARKIHADLAGTLRYARVWGRSGFDGQHVGADHPLADGDVVELHT